MANVAQRSFSAGEISPAMYARSDMERYATALRTLRNAVVLRTGGVQSRPGTEYLGSTKANGEARLVSAVFDTTANYVLEFGDEYVRFWKDGAPITIAAPAAWLTGQTYTVGTLRSNGGTNYLCIGAHTSGASTEPGVWASWQTVWHELEDDIYEWPTPYLAAELFDLQFAFQLDVITIVHPLHPPATLTRIDDDDWVLADIDFNLQANAPTNVAVSGTGGTDWGYTVTAVFADGSESGAGAYVRTNLSSGGVPFAIYTALAAAPRTVTWTAVTGATSYKVYANEGNFSLTELRGTGTGTSFVDNGGFAISFGDPPTASGDFVGAGDYPAVVAAYQQRLLLAGTTNQPDVVQASRVALPYDFSVSSPLVDSDSLEWRQVGRRLNRVRHFMEAAQRLFQFSDVGESIVQGDTDGILRPGEVNPRQFSENGAAVRPAPLVVNDTVLYVQARGSMVRDLAPIQVGGFAGSDLTLQAAHLVDGYELVDWCYQQTPHSVVWAVREDGQLLSLTYVRELGILGWAHHDTLGEIESVCCVPEGTLDAVYAVVKRTIDSNVVRYVERFTNRLADDPILMDASTTVTL
jgi:hypothetical protein